jgi:hypothetical protein
MLHRTCVIFVQETMEQLRQQQPQQQPVEVVKVCNDFLTQSHIGLPA